MDIFLDKITQQAVNYAIRSGVTLTASYALRQTGRLMSAVESSSEKDELQILQDKLQSKIRIVSPAIDMIELISARGNTTLESAVELTGRLRHEIQSIAQRLEKAATDEDLARRGSSRAKPKADLSLELKGVITALRRLLSQIEDAVPFLNLALTTSGAKLSTDLPASISPSRLLQASTFLTAADSQYSKHEKNAIQVGPVFTLSLYMLFAGHDRPQAEEDVRNSTWKEVIHKARTKLMRVPLDTLGQLLHDTRSPSSLEGAPNTAFRASNRADEYAYQLVIIEDFDDDRMHEFETDEPQPGPFEGVARSGIKEAVPIHEIAKIFYADTGKILNIGGEDDTNRPILLLKRDPDASPPRRIVSKLDLQPWNDADSAASEKSEHRDTVQSALDAQLLGVDSTGENLEPVSQATHESLSWRLPSGLDPEWLAFEVYTEAPDSDSDDGQDNGTLSSGLSKRSHDRDSLDSNMLSRFANVQIDDLSTPQDNLSKSLMLHPGETERKRHRDDPALQIKTSLSLLEILLRLTSLQQFQQATHLSIEDEFLNFFLSESATTGAASGDEHERRALREEARRRVGFDPYDESPIKRRGEEYQYRGGTSKAGGNGDGSIVQSIENESPLSRKWHSSSGSSNAHRHRFSATDFPPMRLRNSPARSSRQGTPEKLQNVSSPLSNSKKMVPSRLSQQRHTAEVDRKEEVSAGEGRD